GYVYLHGGYYQDVEIDPENPPPDALVTTHSGGRVTDVLLRNQPGDLPLTRPLLSLGVPRDIVVALDPILRAIIETGYDRPANGAVVSDQPVRFKLLPGPDQLLQDSRAVSVGAVQTAEALGSPVESASSVHWNPTAARLQEHPVDAATEGTPKKAKPTTQTTPLLVEGAAETTKPTPRQAPQVKFSPVRASSGGWKPGALLRSLRDAVQSTAARKPSEPSAPSILDTPEKVADSPADDATPSSEG
ncbi:MAG: PE-PPE domain-containing protein, partial [Mycolicibacterium sp.]|nr:PE-PPE domain-containing protein [Mycolicibacterium sp.]